MSERRVLVVGAGRRVLETALPALVSLAGTVRVARVLARSARPLAVPGLDLGVEPLDALRADPLRPGDLVYVAVAKEAVPKVLRRLLEQDVSQVDLLVDTPVLLLKHFGASLGLRRFRTATAAEDSITLPWLPPVQALIASGEVGPLRQAILFHAGYRYHALALLKQLFDGAPPRSARRVRWNDASGCLVARFDGGGRAWVVEPRDYRNGRMLLVGAHGSITDYPHAAPGNVALEVRREGERVVGFAAGDHVAPLPPEEVALIGDAPPGASVTALTERLKRVAFRRLVQRVLDGSGGYPVEEALDDMAIDWFCDKVGFHRAVAPMDLKGRIGRGVWRALGRRG